MMKVVAVLFLAVAVTLARPEGEQYDTKFDKFDVDSLIDNPRLLKGFAHCFLGTGNCTPEAGSFKKLIPDAVETSCSKCTPQQTVLVRKVINAFQEKLPEEMADLRKLYDPEGKHKEGIDKFLTASA